jgi:hypothetical protein
LSANLPPESTAPGIPVAYLNICLKINPIPLLVLSVLDSGFEISKLKRGEFNRFSNST